MLRVSCLISPRETRLSELVREVEQELKRKEEGRLTREKIARLWNGHMVVRHFRVEGQEIGRLLMIGQDYVRGRLARGEENISEAEIVERIREHLKGSTHS